MQRNRFTGQVKRRHEKAAESPVLDAVGANDLKKKAASHLWLATNFKSNE